MNATSAPMTAINTSMPIAAYKRIEAVCSTGNSSM